MWALQLAERVCSRARALSCGSHTHQDRKYTLLHTTTTTTTITMTTTWYTRTSATSARCRATAISIPTDALDLTDPTCSQSFLLAAAESVESSVAAVVAVVGADTTRTATLTAVSFLSSVYRSHCCLGLSLTSLLLILAAPPKPPLAAAVACSRQDS
jgi:hypothetical protein